MDDIFNLTSGGLGWHLTAHLIAIAALLIACFAILGYIKFKDESIPGSALKDEGVDLSNIDADTLTLTGNATANSIASNVGALGMAGTYATTLTADATLTANTAVAINVTAGNATFTLPSLPSKGDTVRLVWIADNAAHDIVIKSSATADTAPFWSTSSYVFLPKLDVGAANTADTVSLVTVPTASQEIFTIDNTGTDQCSGVGTQLTCTYNGSAWDLQGYIKAGGAASAVPTATFSS